MGIGFENVKHSDSRVTIKMEQKAFIDHVASLVGLGGDGVNTVKLPYRSGHPVGTIKTKEYTSTEQQKLTHEMQVLCGCLNWLSISTRPDIATITNLLAKHTAKPSKDHITAAKRVV